VTVNHYTRNREERENALLFLSERERLSQSENAALIQTVKRGVEQEIIASCTALRNRALLA
jgi:hypothetical protein